MQLLMQFMKDFTASLCPQQPSCRGRLASWPNTTCMHLLYALKELLPLAKIVQSEQSTSAQLILMWMTLPCRQPKSDNGIQPLLYNSRRSAWQILLVPTSQRAEGCRTFASEAPRLWRELQTVINRRAETKANFMRLLKTHLLGNILIYQCRDIYSCADTVVLCGVKRFEQCSHWKWAL